MPTESDMSAREAATPARGTVARWQLQAELDYVRGLARALPAGDPYRARLESDAATIEARLA